MRIGEVLRYARPYPKYVDNQPPPIIPQFVDGYANYFYKTQSNTSSNKLALLEKGINPIGSIKSPDGLRTAAILISSSPNKAGTEVTPWDDIFDPNNGYIRYYGDNKSPSMMPEKAPGNSVLLKAFTTHSSPESNVRADAVPIIFFERERRKGYVIFQGFGIIRHAELVAQISGGIPFSNYVFDFIVLKMLSENENFNWQWIDDRRDKKKSTKESLRYAPASWKEWVKRGPDALDKLKRSISDLQTVPTKKRKPKKGSKEEKILTAIYKFYEHRRNEFEALAADVSGVILSESGRYKPGWITPQTSDNGVDFIARLDIGSDFATTKLIVLGQAKCEKLTSPTNGVHIARTVARLKRGWIGIYVTTSYFSEQVQKEVIEDEYPLIMVDGLRLAREVSGIVIKQGYGSIREYLEDLSQRYPTMISARRPEEVLFM